MKFKKGDKVVITIGKDKGQEGTIERVITKEEKVIVPGVNIYKKHVKGQGDNKGGIYEIPRPLALGKFALVCPKCKKMTRIGMKFAGKDKVRICKKCGKEIDTK
jgi:large subunit ribosomal protein L24